MEGKGFQNFADLGRLFGLNEPQEHFPSKDVLFSLINVGYGINIGGRICQKLIIIGSFFEKLFSKEFKITKKILFLLPPLKY